MFIEQSEDEKKKQQQEEQGNLENPNIGAGGGAEIQPSVLGTTTNTSRLSPVSQSSPQNFGTIQDYFKGSKQQGERFGEQFTGKIEDTRAAKEGQIGQAAEGALGDVESGTVGFDQDLITRAVSDPSKVSEDEDEFSKFLKQWDASYKGPQTFEGSQRYGEAAKAAQDAEAKAAQLGTTGGRQQVIQDEFDVYGQGNKGLDEALLQQSSFFPKVGEQATGLRSLRDYLQSQSETVADKAQVARATTEDTRRQARDAFLGEKGAVKEFQRDIDERTAADQKKAEEQIKDLRAAIDANVDLSEDQLSLMGINKDQYNQLRDQARRVAETARRLPGAEDQIRAASTQPQFHPAPAGQFRAAVMPRTQFVRPQVVSPVQGNLRNLKDYLTTQNPSARITRENTATDADFQRDAALAKLTGRSRFLGADADRSNLAALDFESALKDYQDEAADNERVTREYEEGIRAGLAAEEAARNAARTAKRKDTQNRILGAIATGGIGLAFPQVGQGIKDAGKKIGQEAKRTVKKVKKVVKKIFCFTGTMEVEMADGSKKPIKDIKLGDKTRGGLVESVRQSLTADGSLFLYKGVVVTGFHAVKDGRWIRVKDSPNAGPIAGGGVVYSLVTDKHRIFVNGVEFADEHETDQYEYRSLDESLVALNAE